MKQRILCIEDDPTMHALVEVALPEFEVIPALTLKAGEALLNVESFAALIIDIHLPDGDGLRFLTRISQQEKWKRIPILILTGHDEISNKVMAFSFGAEDFLSKPFDPIELNARLTAKVRKFSKEIEDAQSRRVGDIVIDFSKQKAFRVLGLKEKEIGLTSIELKLLSLFTKRLEQVYSREQIMNQVWGETFITDRTVDSHIAHLRQKLSESSVEIETAKNFGYRAVLREPI